MSTPNKHPMTPEQIWDELDAELRQGMRWSKGLLDAPFPSQACRDRLRDLGLLDRCSCVTPLGEDVFLVGVRRRQVQYGRKVT